MPIWVTREKKKNEISVAGLGWDRVGLLDEMGGILILLSGEGGKEMGGCEGVCVRVRVGEG